MQEDQHAQAAAIEHFYFGQVQHHYSGPTQTNDCVLQKMKRLAAYDSSGALQKGHVPRLLSLDV
jgi:hypothetical protein